MLLTFVNKLSGISVNKGTSWRLGWTEYSDFMKLSTRASTLFIFIVCFLTGERNAGKVYCRSHIKIANTVTCTTACICILFKQYSHYGISLFTSYFCRWTVYGHCFQQTRSCQNHVSIHSFFSLLYTVSCYPDLDIFETFCLKHVKSSPVGGYSESQVTRMIEVFFWVWNFRLWDFW